MESEALAVGDVTDVGAELAVGPEEIADRGQELLDVIVLLDQLGDVAGRAGCGNVLYRLCRLGVKTHARDVLREHGNERETKALVKIGDELVARHFLELAVVAGAVLGGQMPVHVVGIPPGVLEALPEQARLANAADLVASRDNALFAVLANKLAQCVHQLGLNVFEPLVVWAEVDRLRSASLP